MIVLVKPYIPDRKRADIDVGEFANPGCITIEFSGDIHDQDYQLIQTVRLFFS